MGTPPHEYKSLVDEFLSAVASDCSYAVRMINTVHAQQRRREVWDVRKYLRKIFHDPKITGISGWVLSRELQSWLEHQPPPPREYGQGTHRRLNHEYKSELTLQAIELRKSGYTYAHISEKLGLSVATTWRFVHGK